MSDYAPIQLSHERNSQGVGGTERGDDELLRVIANWQSTECSDCDISNGTDIGVGLTPDDYPGPHAIPVFIGERPDCAAPTGVRTNEQLYPALPNGGIAATVKDGKDNHRVPTNPEVHRKWEAACNCAPNIAEYNGIALWGSRRARDCLVNFDNKLLTKTWSLLVVSVGCIIEFAPCRTSEDYA